ncbi:MAG: hypothetical protein LRZ84_00635 [Desertifilum sp.]|nr:hypothetical protein [Desertifilum sp.]
MDWAVTIGSKLRLQSLQQVRSHSTREPLTLDRQLAKQLRDILGHKKHTIA